MTETMIGLESHLSLNCATKLFCGCPVVSKEAKPNTSTCPTCLGHPGSKPVLNRKAVDYAIKLALALSCKINKEFIFSRKTYFYPDLPKNFQITQYEVPLGKEGFIELDSGKKIRITRVHLEEDPGALVHEAGMGASNYVLVDYNRAGVPLCEIVTEPDISSKEEAKEYLDKLKAIIDYLDIFDSEKGSIKTDTNVSIEGGERVEIKNVSGVLSGVFVAIDSELRRQQKVIKDGDKVIRETRAFDEATGTTTSLRKKETEDDYGFIAEPDLTKIELDPNWIATIKNELPELPEQKAKKFREVYGLNEYDAKVISGSLSNAVLFEATVEEVEPNLAAKFISRELQAILNYGNLNLKELNLDANEIIKLLKLLQNGKVSEKNAKEAMIKYCNEKITPEKFLKDGNLLIDLKAGDVEKVVKEVLGKNPQAVEELKQGKGKALNFLIGASMRELKGKANAREIEKIIKGMI